MRQHPDDYAPFVVDGDAEGGDAADGCVIMCRDAARRASTDATCARCCTCTAVAVASFERYCQSVEGTAAWGGQLELRALAHVLRRRICVFSAHLPTVELGEDYSDDGSDANPPLRVAHQQLAYGLGEPPDSRSCRVTVADIATPPRRRHGAAERAGAALYPPQAALAWLLRTSRAVSWSTPHCARREQPDLARARARNART